MDALGIVSLIAIRLPRLPPKLLWRVRASISYAVGTSAGDAAGAGIAWTASSSQPLVLTLFRLTADFTVVGVAMPLAPAIPCKTKKISLLGRCLSPFFHKRSAQRYS